MKEETKKQITKKTKSEDFNLDLEEMTKAGLYFGHRTSRIHPKMKPYISTTRNNVHIIDLEKTAENFKKALKFIKETISENKVLLVIGTKIQSKNLTKEFAKDCGLPYIVERWLGGTFTNFRTIKKRVEYFKDLEDKKKKGELKKYTKKERIKIDRELKNLENKFGGIKNLEKIPDVIFVLDMKKDSLAVKEAEKKGVKIVAVADTNVDPSLVDYPIPANDDAISSIKYILDKVKEVIIKSQKSGIKRKEAEEKNES